MTRRRDSHAAHNLSRRRVWILVAIGLFLLLDAYLVTTALTATGSNSDSVMAPLATDLAPAPTSTPTASTPPVNEILPAPASRILSAVSSSVAWRAVVGTCPDPLAAPEFSSDGGATWTVTDANGPTDITALQSIEATNASVAQFVGLAAADCSPQMVRTFVGGDNYSLANNELESSWYVDPANRSELHSPGGLRAAPCDAVVDLVSGATANEAAVLCADARFFTTADGGASWSSPLRIAGALTLAATADGYVAVAVGAEAATTPATCPGLRVVNLSAAPAMDPTATTTGCFATTEAPAVLADTVALAGADDTLWLWIGDVIVRSTDAGRTWA